MLRVSRTVADLGRAEAFYRDHGQPVRFRLTPLAGADVDAATTAFAIVGQLRGIALQRLVDPAAVDVRTLAPAVAAQWRRALAPDADGQAR